MTPGERLEQPAIVRPADPAEMLRCFCPTCLMLDARYPGQGYQMALFPWRPAPRIYSKR